LDEDKQSKTGFLCTLSLFYRKCVYDFRADGAEIMSSLKHLQRLAEIEFPDLQHYPFEISLLKHVVQGTFASARTTTGTEEEGIAPSADWQRDRHIRPKIIRWLCASASAKALVDPAGIRIQGAVIPGPLNLGHIDIPFPLVLLRCRLDDEFTLTDSSVRMLQLTGSWTRTIIADGVDVKYAVFMDSGFRSNGGVSLAGSRIGGQLACDGATFIGSGTAIAADNIVVGGDVALRAENSGSQLRPFRAEGLVRFLGAQIGGDLICVGGEFIGTDVYSLALAGSGIKGSLILRSGGRDDGDIAGSKLKVKGKVDLSNVSVGVFDDGFESQSQVRADWPASNDFSIDGMTYRRIVPESREAQMELLSFMRSNPPQPYRQLAGFFAESGRTNDAKAVLKRMEANLAKTNPVRLPLALIGYGYNPENALGAQIVLFLFGWLLYWRANRMNVMVPAEKEAYTSEEPAVLAAHYPRFNPMLYSLDATLPVINLGHRPKWHPAPSPPKEQISAHRNRLRRLIASIGAPTPKFVRIFHWLQVLLGWLLSFFFSQPCRVLCSTASP
jgi:hypothetical protein